MQTSVAPSSHASRARRTTSSRGNRYPSSSRWSRLNAQKPQCLMETLVKLTLRFTTNVTVSPAWRRRSSSAVTLSASRSRPAARARRLASATETSPPASAPSRMRRTSREARSSAAPGLPASPVFMRFPDEPVAIDQRRHARTERLVDELRSRGERRIDGEALAEDEAGGLGGAPQLGEPGPGLLGVDVVRRERRDAAPVVEAGRQQARVYPRAEVRRRLQRHVRWKHQASDGERAEQLFERGLRRVLHRDERLGTEGL